jgi:hypothetical protein
MINEQKYFYDDTTLTVVYIHHMTFGGRCVESESD